MSYIFLFKKTTLKTHIKKIKKKQYKKNDPFNIKIWLSNPNCLDSITNHII
jgi:hypothetical protein